MELLKLDFICSSRRRLLGSPICLSPSLIKGSMMRGERKLLLARKFSQNNSGASGLKESMRLLSSKEILLTTSSAMVNLSSFEKYLRK